MYPLSPLRYAVAISNTSDIFLLHDQRSVSYNVGPRGGLKSIDLSRSALRAGRALT
jgi:hypothetical protein